MLLMVCYKCLCNKESVSFDLGVFCVPVWNNMRICRKSLLYWSIKLPLYKCIKTWAILNMWYGLHLLLQKTFVGGVMPFFAFTYSVDYSVNWFSQITEVGITEVLLYWQCYVFIISSWKNSTKNWYKSLS